MTSRDRSRAELGFQGGPVLSRAPWGRSGPAAPPKKLGETYAGVVGARYIIRTSDGEVIPMVKKLASAHGKVVREEGAFTVLELPTELGRSLVWPPQILGRVQFGVTTPESSKPAIEGKSIEISQIYKMPSPFK